MISVNHPTCMSTFVELLAFSYFLFVLILSNRFDPKNMMKCNHPFAGNWYSNKVDMDSSMG